MRSETDIIRQQRIGLHLNQWPAFALFLLVLTLLLGLIGYFAVRLMREDNQGKDHQLGVQVIAQSIEYDIQERRKLLAALARDSDIIAALTGVSAPGDLRTRMVMEVAEEVAGAEKIIVFNASGRAIAASEGTVEDLARLSLRTMPFVQDSLQGRFAIYPALDPSNKIPGVFLSLPVYLDSNEPPIGALALKLGMAGIESLMMVLDEITALISPEGVIFSTNRPIWMYCATRPMTYPETQRLKNTRQFGEDPLVPLEIDFTADELALEGTQYRVARAPLAIAGWVLVSCQRKAVVSALPLLWRYLIGITLVVMGSLAILVFFLTSTIYRHRKTAMMLCRSEDKYHSIFSNVAMGIYQSTLQGRFIDANPHLARMLGYRDPQELINQVSDIGGQIYATPMDREEYLRILQEAGQVQGFETRFKRKDGTTIWISSWGRMVGGGPDAEPFLEGFVMDVTDKVQAKHDAKLREQQLRHADRMISLGILTSGMAHEINNPNTFIMSNAQLFLDAWVEAKTILDDYYRANGDFVIGGIKYSRLKEEMPQMGQRILQGSRRIKRIVEELKVFSKQGGGALKTPVNLNEVIASAEVLLGNMIKKSTHCFRKDLAPDLPPVMANYQRLEQVIVNLVQNACQSLPAPDKRIDVSTARDPATGDVLFVCRDEGIGIAEEHLAHTMDPFFTTKRESGGTGLGLSISLSIVREYGGSLSLTSKLGIGTTVYLRLPVTHAEPSAEHTVTIDRMAKESVP